MYESSDGTSAGWGSAEVDSSESNTVTIVIVVAQAIIGREPIDVQAILEDLCKEYAAEDGGEIGAGQHRDEGRAGAALRCESPDRRKVDGPSGLARGPPGALVG